MKRKKEKKIKKANRDVRLWLSLTYNYRNTNQNMKYVFKKWINLAMLEHLVRPSARVVGSLITAAGNVN